ncbi:MAG: fumarylacetoacetate hydrolase family protein [Tannerella sp.]|jgi:2-keto-4-pentenoate hydratase/2-oxohepta-3-ene-1,7-dioic acid hydratase in catechol pathway|nr:fumarylacetoacetate hydrolase family protein [Tannerella sp.]
MKIIAVGMNYATHNKEMHHPLHTTEPAIFMKADSVLKNGKPFFLPDFSSDIQYETEVVIRICRLGKSISERFAYRYYDEVTAGIDFTARDLQTRLRDSGLPWELSKAFDSSAAVGTFIPLAEAGRIGSLTFHLDINGQTVQQGRTADMIFTVDSIIARVSRYFTLRTGDLIFTGTPAGVGTVHVGDRLQGYLGDRMLLDFYVR